MHLQAQKRKPSDHTNSICSVSINIIGCAKGVLLRNVKLVDSFLYIEYFINFVTLLTTQYYSWKTTIHTVKS